jgi:Outer membrane protein beta-barrel domain
MKSVLAPLCLFAQLLCFAQRNTEQKTYKKKLGLKVGCNWSYATASTSGIRPNTTTGYMAGAFLALPSRGLGFRSEIIYSHQGYSFQGSGSNTTQMNDYIYLPQLTTFSIGRFFQLQAGAQVGILMNGVQRTGGKDTTITGLMNRLDYGFAGGVEINPVAGLIIGGRYNLGLGTMYKHLEESRTTSVSPYPLPFDPNTTNLKNGVIQFFVGYKF